MYYGYNSSALMASSIWMIVALILGIIGGIVLYFTFLSKKNEGRFHGFWGWMYDFLTFKKLLAENLLRILYLILALFITLASFSFIGANFFIFILTLVIGNVVIRIAYEFFLVKLLICKNTTEINAKLSKDNRE